MMRLLTEQPPNLPAGYLIAQLPRGEFVVVRRDINGKPRRIQTGRNSVNYGSLAGAVSAARMAASRIELKGKKLSRAAGSKRRRTGGHGYSGGDGFVEI